MEPDPANPGGSITESQAAAPDPNEVISQSVWETALNNWLGAHIRGTPVTEYSQAWAHLSSVLPELKTFLEAELAKHS
jgi:hypothetical protein